MQLIRCSLEEFIQNENRKIVCFGGGNYFLAFIEECTNLTQEQAKELLVKYNNKVDYIYQGTEDNFEYLKSKNLHGYVFLPDTDTDIGYFVDKQSSKIYYFHPSGYLELAQ